MSIRFALIGAAGGAALLAVGWAAWNWHGSSRYDVGYKAAEKAMAAEVAIESLASASRLAALETAHREIERLNDENENALRAAVDAGSVRLHVNANCPGVPEAADPGMGERARPELAAAARPDYHALRSGLIKIQGDLDLCRAAVRELTEQTQKSPLKAGSW